MSPVVTIVLAAGSGKRLGGPKAMLAWPSGRPGKPPARAERHAPPPRPSSPGHAPPPRPSSSGLSPSSPGLSTEEVPLAIAHAEARLGAESQRIVVVVRKPLMKPLLKYVRIGLDIVASEAEEELGPAGSLAVAQSRLGDAAAIVVTPVDAPPAKADTVGKLLAGLAADPTLLAVRPVYKGKAGHPVALRRAALERYTQPSPPPLRDHLRALGAAVGDVEVSDPTVLIDLNTPADVMGLLRTLPRFLD